MSLKPSSELLSFRRSVRQPAADPLSWAFPKLPEWSEFVEDASDDSIDLAGEGVHGLLRCGEQRRCSQSLSEGGQIDGF